MEIYACIVGRSKRPYYYMFNLASRTDEIELVYPFWVIKDNGRVILIDTGISDAMVAEKGILDYRSPDALMQKVGVDPKDLKTIVISHLHYDHFTVPERFPNAVFYIQRDDMDYFTGRGKDHPAFKSADPAAIAQIAKLRASGNIKELSGDFALAPSIKLVHVGGHTPGHQITVVDLDGKPTVFACDASHFYANLQTRTPTSIIHNYDNYQTGFSTISALANGGRWFPGHDPAILERLEKVDDRIYRVGSA